MTTPGQPAPDGAYIIGGSGNAYGQEMTDASAAHLMLGGFTSIASIANPLDAVGAAMNMFAQSLLKLPLDVLKLFEPLIPGDLGAVFNTVSGAVGAIMGFFQQIGPLLTSTFNSFITTSYNILSSGFQQILDIVNGLVVVPISSAVSGFKDWFTGLMGSTIPDLGTAVSGAVNDVADLIHDLLTAPASVLGSIPQTLVSGLTGALSDVNGFVQGVVNAIIQAISGIPFVGGSIAAALAALTGAVQVQQANQQAAVVTVASTPAVTERWKSPYPISDVSYPEIFHSAFAVEGTTTSASTGTAHTHSMFGASGLNSGNAAYVPQFSIFVATRMGGTICTSSSTVYDTVAMYLGNASTTLNNVFVEVLRRSSDGSLVQVSSQEVSASITTPNATYLEFTLPTPIIANAGETYIVTVRNSSTNPASKVNLYAMASEVPMGFLTSGSTDSNKTSYTSSEEASFRHRAMSPNSGPLVLYQVVWAMLATTGAAPDQLTYTDNFDNRSSFGPKWYPKFSTPGAGLIVVNNRATYKGTVAGDQAALYTLPVGSDAMVVEANIYGRVPTSHSGVMLCCNREFTQTVYLGLEGLFMRLFVGPWNALTQVGLWSAGPGDAKWAVANDPVTGIFTIFRDGTAVQTWNSAGTVQFGEQFRYGGLRATKSVAAGTLTPGTMDNFVFRDA